ncbi:MULTISPECIES: polyprenyl synthetase family protein [unclassified Actinobaculum]|uniref:polyprenyl synthetase family protein n=1 Tax=unclassified Actinobaculum TaxID=2609299 RepID=UPI000D5296C2|nr:MULTISPECIES: polyprenyl synthetase family protein [unclassified Actinobaculum]AWE42518.1 hypothetical protein DDD63_06870 [Actinobaculum sp. 313]RTE48739.1 polyprenyl synthetase family protein [Actinobaculum sp. 352]
MSFEAASADPVDPNDFRAAVTARCLAVLDSLSTLFGNSDAVAELQAVTRPFLAGGKRTRATLLLAGWCCATDEPTSPAVSAGAALELFQASALVHDDVIDASPTRRGLPAAHAAFAQRHQSADWTGDPSRFGTAAAITLGDLLLSEAVSEFARAGALVPSIRAQAATGVFHDMTLEVAYGQFLDIRAENLPLADPSTEGSNALTILRHKSARYSVELPLIIGATLAGAPSDLLAGLRRVGTPLGEAFQLRDDDLGIFGDPQTTGKPSGADFSEGKRTVLLSLSRALASSSNRDWLEQNLGSPLNHDGVEHLRRIIIKCGARQRHEDMINQREEEARSALKEFPARSVGTALLSSLFDELSARAR